MADMLTAAHLLEIARPSATTVRPHDVEIAFDGALVDRERLGAAIELAAWWAAAPPAPARTARAPKPTHHRVAAGAHRWDLPARLSLG